MTHQGWALEALADVWSPKEKMAQKKISLDTKHDGDKELNILVNYFWVL